MPDGRILSDLPDDLKGYAGVLLKFHDRYIEVDLLPHLRPKRYVTKA